MSTLQTLVEMGFSEQRASRALDVTGNKGVEPAMEWLLAHIDDPITVDETGAGPSDPANETTPGAETLVLKPEPGAEDAAQLAKSIKCNDCNRLFKTQTEVEFHAAKSGHVDFSESTEEKQPLTEEQKREQLALLESKLKQKRVEREEREKQDEVERERVRIKSGKDLSEARRKMEEEEMKKIVDLRKREKQDEKLARDRVRAQIENDKAARKMRQQTDAGSPPEQPAVVVAATVPTQFPKSPSTAPGTYSQTRIQVRLQSGAALTQTFNVKEQLAAVRLFVEMNSESDASFGLMTTFPRKVFADEDFDKPLDALGLVPSAVIMVTKGWSETFKCNNEDSATVAVQDRRWQMTEEEKKEMIAQRCRQKQEEQMAKDRVIDQIEDDKARRKIRQQRIISTPSKRAVVAIESALPRYPKSPSSPTYRQTVIQIRLQNGDTLTETFSVREQLSAVRLFVEMQVDSATTVQLMTPYPRQVFSGNDYLKPLDSLGLVPSAILVVT